MSNFPIVANHPDYDRSGTSKFIPEIWTGKLLVKFYKSTVFAAIANTDYEGEIKDTGSKVIIRTTPSITIRNYKKGQKLIHEKPENANVELLIDKGKYFSAECDDVDRVQADINLMDTFANDAGEQMKIAIDTDILGNIYADVSADNKGATAGLLSKGFNFGATGAPVALTKVNIINYLVDAGTILDEQNIPETGRWIVIPAWMCGMIKKSDLKDASLSGDGTSMLRNGRLGMIDRFTLYSSNNLTGVTDGAYTAYNVTFGHKAGLTFAAQIVKTRSVRSTETFNELIQGLNVYGYKVTKPDTLGVLYCRQG